LRRVAEDLYQECPGGVRGYRGTILDAALGSNYYDGVSSLPAIAVS
jgi:hypothetical protein